MSATAPKKITEPLTDPELAKALRAERDFSDAVLNNLPGLFFHFDENGRLLRWNKAVEAVTGYAPEELARMNPPELFPEEERPRLAAHVARMTEKGGDTIESALLCKDGRRIPYLFTATYFTQDNRTGFIGLAFDISQIKQLEQQLQQERDYSNAIIEALPGIFYHYDAQGHFIRGNRSSEIFSGYTLEERKHMRPTQFIAEEDRAMIATRIKEMLASQTPAAAEAHYLHKDGHKTPVLFNSVPFNYNGQPGFLGIGLDISTYKHLEELLEQERGYLNAIINSLPGIFFHHDHEHRLLLGNRNLETISGYTLEEHKKLGLTPLDFFEGEDRERIAAGLREVFEHGQHSTEATYTLRDGRKIPYLFSVARFGRGNRAGYIGVGIDISERKLAEDTVQYLATHDELTGLANHMTLWARLAQAIMRGHDKHTALLRLDLDRFKSINDGYGHSFGDLVLKAVAKQLTDLLPEANTIARHGGDEFLVLLTDLQSTDDAYAIARKIVESFHHPIVVQGRDLYLSASIGCALFPQDGETADVLISNTDIAMYQAKNLGRDTYQFFTRDMGDKVQRRIELETHLRNAIYTQDFHLVYQPKVSFETGRICGCEALLRWECATQGAISPERFIPVAEDSGLIVPLGNWVLRTACAQARSWLDAGLPPTSVAVNISARQFLQQDVVAWVLRSLEETGLPAELLELELTESLVAHDVEKVIATLRELKELGIKLAIDDFGTGYSSLNYLKHFRVDRLKIDKSFIRNMLEQTEDASIVLTIVDLAHNLNFKVIAEGVEDERQCKFLRSIRCHEIQGYYFSQPVRAEEFEHMLRNDKQLN